MVQEFINSFNKSPIGKGEELYIEALVQFLDVFSQEFIGTSNISYARVFQHVQSGQFHWFTAFQIQTVDDAMEMIEEAVLNGAPIWNMLYLDNPLQEQIFKELEEAYIEDCKRKEEEQRIANLKIYKCLTCKHYKIGLYEGHDVPIELPGMRVFTRRCSYIEGSDLKHTDKDYYKKSEERRKIEGKVIDYHPGQFNVYKEKNKNGCKGYQYDKRRDK